MSVANPFTTRFHKVLLEASHYCVDILLTKADDSSIVDNDISKKCIGICVPIDRRAFSLRLALASFVAPLQTTHGDYSNEHHRAACYGNKGHLPGDE